MSNVTRDPAIEHLEASPAVRGTRGGFRGRGRGGHASARNSRAKSSGINVISPCDCPPFDMPGIGNPSIGRISTITPCDVSQPNSSPLIDGSQSNGSLLLEADGSKPNGSLRAKSPRSSENNPNLTTVL